MPSNISMRKALTTFVRERLMLPTLALFFLAAIFTGYQGIRTMGYRHEGIAQFAAQRLDREITHLNSFLSFLAESLQGKTFREIARILNQALGEGYFESFYLVDRSGSVILTMPSNQLFPSRFSPKGFYLDQNPSGRISIYLTCETHYGFLIATINSHYLRNSIASELTPIYKGQLFLADAHNRRFPLFPLELGEEHLGAEPLPPAKQGSQVYRAGSAIFIRGAYPLGKTGVTVIARSQLLQAVAPFIAWGFVLLALGVIIWFTAMRTAYRQLEKRIINPIEVLLEGIKNLHKGRALPCFPSQLPEAPAELNQLISAFKEMADEITTTQAALVRSEREKSLVLEGVSDLVTLQSLDLRIQWANKAAGDSVGKRPEELVGKHCYEIWHGRSSPCAGCPVVKAIKTESYQESEIVTPDGRVWFIRARPLKDEGGKVIGVVETTTEITQLRRAEAEQRTLAEISQALNRADLREAFPTLARALTQLLNCQRIVLLLLDEKTMTFHITNLFSELPVPELCDGFTFSGKDTAALEPILAGKINCSTDLEEYSSFPVEKALVRAGYRSRIVFPLRFEGRTIGALALVSTRPEPFWEGKVDFLQQVSDVLAMALARDQAYQHEREERFFNQVLAETVALTLKTSSPEEFFDQILEKVAQVIPGDAFNLMFVIGDYAQVVSHKGYEKREVEEKIKWLHFPLSEYQTLWTVYNTGEPLLVPDTSAVSLWVQASGFEWIKSYMCAPLKIGGKVMGFLNVDGARPFQFTSRDLQRLQIFADYLALALDRARMLVELKEYSDQMERLVRERTEHLQARQAWLDAIFKGSSDGYLLLNLRGEILEMNPVAWAWLHKLASPEEAESLKETLREMAYNAQAYPETVKELKAGDLHIKIVPLEPGYPGSLAILHEITHLKVLDKMKSKLITDISHELRTPMSALKLYAELVCMSPLEKQKFYVEQILHLIDQLATLINDIIEVANIETGKVVLKLSPVELNLFVEKALEKHRPRAERQQHRLEFIPSPDNPTIMADSHRLEQILSNLVDNAIRYTPDGGRITVSVDICEEDGQLWGVIKVTDNGLGIPEEELPHIFERFFRGEEARAQQISGSGLGLSIVKELVDLHKGKIKVKSKVGEGTTFTVMLPLLSSEA